MWKERAKSKEGVKRRTPPSKREREESKIRIILFKDI
jgi:hypothetical protein